MPEIKVLSPHLVNLIKAGEVIENVASVVKELVENSIDAGASMINVTLQEAGLKEIIVADNGCGMSVAESRLSIQPHATSKIANENDLFNISTLGFRGEALASIVAVSKFKVKTCCDGSRGYMFTATAGEITSECLLALPQGTEISVRNLFYNTVARLQNLKSEAIELSHVSDFISRIALANPHIAFKLTNNNKTILQTYGTKSVLEVLSNIYGNDIAKEMVAIASTTACFRLSGYISKIAVSRSTRSHVNLIVNGRIIRNSNILNWVTEAYKTYLPLGRYPICVLDIIVDPSLVDVNVHPTKSDVKFSNEDELKELIIKTISDALSKTDLTVSLKTDAQEELLKEEPQDETVDFESDFSYNIRFENDNKVEVEKIEFDDFEAKDEVKAQILEEEIAEVEEILSTPKQKVIQQEFKFDGEETFEEPKRKLPKMYYIGQLFGTYILAQNEETFYLIDQHAANERINYEKILAEFKKDNVFTYELAIPLKLTFTPAESLLVDQNDGKIRELGIALENFGGGTYTVRQIPLWIKRGFEQEYVEEIIMQIIAGRKAEKYQFLDSLAKTLACKKSVRGNEYLSEMQIEYILEDLEKCENPFTCPHGRPTIMKYSKYEVEKWFKRV